MASCLTPLKVYNKYLKKKVWTSCGGCSHCLENRRQEWKFRFMKEKEVSGLCTHLTLQFDDAHIGDNILDISDLQNFHKRLRSMGFQYRFYAIGEYGTRDERQHYHVAMFLKSSHDFDTFKKAIIKQWPHGYIYFTKLTFRRMGYILHYHVRPKEVNGKKTIATQSKGIGSDWLERPDMARFLIQANTISVQGNDGMFYTFPRYYRKKLGITFENADNIPKAVENLAKRKKKKVVDLDRDEVKDYFLAVKKRDMVRIDKYNHKSN